MKGLDLIRRFKVDDYNQLIETIDSLERLSLNGRSDDGIRGYLVGHSKAFWEPFVDWYRGFTYDGVDDKLKALFENDPVDLYATLEIEKILKKEGITTYRVYSDLEGPLVALQRVAELSGMAVIDHDLHLCLHPTFGPWIALRAVVLCDGPVKEWDEIEQQAATDANQIDRAQLLSDEERAACRVALQQAVADPKNLDLWIKLRDIPTHGKQYRYESDQLSYHYSKNHDILKKLRTSSSPKKNDAQQT